MNPQYRPQPRPLSSPIAPSSGASSATVAGGGTRLAFAPPPSAGKLALSHLASPAGVDRSSSSSTTTTILRSPTRTGGGGLMSSITTVSTPDGNANRVWSPTRGSSVSIKSPLKAATNVAGTTTTTTSTTLHRTSTTYNGGASTSSSGSLLRSPTSGVVKSAPAVSSLLDSMSELRSLIAKKEMELSSLAESRSAIKAAVASTSSLASTIPSAATTAANLASASFAPLSPSRSTNLTSSFLAQTHVLPVSSPLASPLASPSSSHLQTLHDQEIHEYNVRIASLEQALVEREEQFQTIKVELERLKRREESLSAENDVRAQAHKKQVEVLNTNLESLTWNRHESLEKQREEFERLRREMMDELVKKEEIHNLKLHNLNQNLLNYEEQLRGQAAAIEDSKSVAQKQLEAANNTISTLQLEVDTLRGQKQSTKEQLQSGIKQQLTMTASLKTLSRKLEETQRNQETERAEFLSQRAKQESDVARLRAELESKTEELVASLRAVENQLIERERIHSQTISQLEESKEELITNNAQEREQLIEAAHAEKRNLIEDYQAKLHDAALSLTSAQNQVKELERDLQEQRQRMTHEANLAQESWNNLVMEKERDIAAVKRDLSHSHSTIESLRDEKAQLEVTNSALRIELVQTESDLNHSKQTSDETQNRLIETRNQARLEAEQKESSFNQRYEELHARLSKSERDAEEANRSLQVEKLRTSELSSQLHLLRTASQNKLRAVEVARSLEAQALLSDFSAQLGRVKGEISAIKNQTPKDKQREWNRSKRERERVAGDTERSRDRDESRERERSRERLQSPLLSPAGSTVPSARRHVRVRSIGDQSPLSPHTGSQVFGSIPASPRA